MIAEKKKFSAHSGDENENDFHTIAELFFFSDRSDHMETRL